MKKKEKTKLQVSKLKSLMASLHMGRVGVCPVHHHSGERKKERVRKKEEAQSTSSPPAISLR